LGNCYDLITTQYYVASLSTPICFTISRLCWYKGNNSSP